MKTLVSCYTVLSVLSVAWAGDLDLGAMVQPVPMTAKLSDPAYNIWCGAPIKGEDGKYHLYYSRWPRKLGHKAWVTHSEIAHAVGDSPLGPWKHHDVALPARGATSGMVRARTTRTSRAAAASTACSTPATTAMACSATG